MKHVGIAPRITIGLSRKTFVQSLFAAWSANIIQSEWQKTSIACTLLPSCPPHPYNRLRTWMLLPASLSPLLHRLALAEMNFEQKAATMQANLQGCESYVDGVRCGSVQILPRVKAMAT